MKSCKNCALSVFREELNAIRTKSVVLSMLGGLRYTSSAIAVLITVAIMVAVGVRLTATKVFMTVSFMNFVGLTVCYYVNVRLQFLVEALTSFARIEQFLWLPNLPHLHKEDVDLSQEDQLSADGNEGEDKQEEAWTLASRDRDVTRRKTLSVLNVSLRASDKDKRARILHNVTIEASPGSLVVVTGPIGSGKSTVLAAINKEVAINEGRILCSGTTAYVPQTPWVFPGTIRENITFGKDYDHERFTAVLEVCALMKDLQMFPDGDLSVVGEKGAVLSGGQQARISLARAVYADADVYLLDDPLSSVDAKVGQHIFEKCICDFLSAKTVLLVTHQINHMKRANQIVVLSKGEQITRGSYVELKEEGVLDTILAHHMAAVAHPSREPTAHRYDDLTKSTTKGNAAGLEILEEDRSIGTVSLKLYWEYFRAGQSALALIGLAVIFIFGQCK